MVRPLSADEEREAADISNAIEQSLQDGRDMAQRADAQQDDEELSQYRDETEGTPAAPYDPLKAMTQNIDLRLGNEFTPLVDPDGDTLIYIGVPPRSPGQTREEHAHVSKHFDRCFVIQSAALKALQSTKLSNFLRPNPCIRAEKRFKKLDAYSRLDPSIKSRIKFHIDLRPPNEDDEAVLLITDLTCSHGVLAWHLAQETYGLAQNAVAGTDHLDYPSNPYFVTPRPPQGLTHHKNESKSRTKVEIPLAAEYCPLRHHSGLERLIHAITGNDPKLDSAPKMWTFFALAKYFECAQVDVVRNWLINWFAQPGNANFIQNNPETAYRIGLGCQAPNLARDAFAILVGEKALMDVSHQLRGAISSTPYSVHGRPLEILDDDERNRIGHAASSLVQRIRTILDNILVKAEWLNESREFKRLKSLKSEDAAQQQIIRDAQQAVVDYVKFKLGYMLTKSLTGVFEDMYGSRTSDKLPHAKYTLSFVKTYNELSILARPFTRSFWMALLNVDIAVESDLYLSSLAAWQATGLGQAQDLQNFGIALSEPIQAFAIDRKIQMVNGIIAPKQCDGPSRHLPEHLGLDGKRHAQEDWDENPFNESKYSTGDAGASQQFLHHSREQDSRSDEPTSPGKRRKISSDGPYQLPFRFGPPAPTHSAEHHIPAVPPASTLVGGVDARQNDQWSLMSRSSRALQVQFVPQAVPTLPGTHHQESLIKTEELESGSADEIFSMDNDVEDERLPVPVSIKGLRPTDDPWPIKRMPEPDQPGSVAPSWDQYLSNRHRDKERYTKATFPATQDTSSAWSTSISGPQSTFERVRPTLGTNLSDLPKDRAHGEPANTPKRRAVQQFSNSNTGPRWNQHYTSESTSGKKILFQAMMHEFNQIIQRQAQEIVYPAHIFNNDTSLPVGLIDHVFCLTDDEWKFLPLTVGGFDDGTGGVFDETIPNLEAGGFRGGKRGIGKVDATGEDSESGSSSFDDVASDAISTIGKASKLATDGTETVKSYDDKESDGGFDYTDLYGEVQQLKIEQQLNDANENEAYDAMKDSDGASTVMRANSDVQGQFFGGDDGDDDLLGDNDSTGENDEESSRERKGKYAAEVKNESDEDEDLEIIDMDRL